MNERDTLIAMESRYERQILERQTQIDKLRLEIESLRSAIHGLRVARGVEEGKPVEDLPRPQVVRSMVDARAREEDDSGKYARGWLTGKVTEYVTGVARDVFTGAEVVRWIKGQGFDVSKSQYNHVYTLLSNMANEGKWIAKDGSRWRKLHGDVRGKAQGLHDTTSEVNEGEGVQAHQERIEER